MNAKSSVVRKVRNGVCISALIGLVGWAWWNDHIRFPGEEEFREKERLQQTTLQREIHVSESNPMTSSFKVPGSAYGDLKINQAVFARGATLYLRTEDEQLIAVGKKAYNTWLVTIEVRDNWTIKIFDSDILDERLLILLAAFQTATGR